MTTKKLIAPLILVMALTLPACQNEKQTATGEAVTTASEMTPEQLGELGAAIKKQPAEAQRLLAEKGLSEESFEQAIRRVTEDPAASKRYAEAYRKAS